jgi:hypothetical protein
MTWMPSCELPAMRMTASLILETFGVPPDNAAVAIGSLMDFKINSLMVRRLKTNQRDAIALSQ